MSFVVVVPLHLASRDRVNTTNYTRRKQLARMSSVAEHLLPIVSIIILITWWVGVPDNGRYKKIRPPITVAAADLGRTHFKHHYGAGQHTKGRSLRHSTTEPAGFIPAL